MQGDRDYDKLLRLLAPLLDGSSEAALARGECAGMAQEGEDCRSGCARWRSKAALWTWCGTGKLR